MPFMPRFGDDPNHIRSHQILTRENEQVSQLEPIPGQEVCDFCDSHHPVWKFGADDGIVVTVPLAVDSATGVARPEDHVSEGGWLACERCKTFIDRGDAEGLATDCADGFCRDHPSETAGIPRSSIRRHFLGIQAAFWDHRRPDQDGPIPH